MCIFCLLDAFFLLLYLVNFYLIISMLVEKLWHFFYFPLLLSGPFPFPLCPGKTWHGIIIQPCVLLCSSLMKMVPGPFFDWPCTPTTSVMSSMLYVFSEYLLSESVMWILTQWTMLYVSHCQKLDETSQLGVRWPRTVPGSGFMLPVCAFSSSILKWIYF